MNKRLKIIYYYFLEKTLPLMFGSDDEDKEEEIRLMIQEIMFLQLKLLELEFSSNI